MATAAANFLKLLRWNGTIFTQAQTSAPVALSTSGSILVDASLSNNFTLQLVANGTLTNPTGLLDGVVLNILVRRAVPSFTLGYQAMWEWADDVVPALSTSPNTADLIVAQYWAATNKLVCTMYKGVPTT